MKHERLSVCFVTRKWAPAIGGMETYSLRLTQELECHADVTIVALPGRANGAPPSALSYMLFPFTFLRKWFAGARRCDVLHIGDMAIWPLALASLLPGSRSTVVLSAHGTDVTYPLRQGVKGRLYGAYQRLGARVLRNAAVMANSRATGEMAQRLGWSVEAIIPLATDLRPSTDASKHGSQLLFVGRLIPLKGLSWFVEAVMPKLPDTITLDVAGTIWDDNEGEALAHPRVRYIGSLAQSQLCSAYQEALCVVIPNIERSTGEFEGFGLVGPEAAVCGGVVLASRSGGLVDSILDDETGILIEPGNSQLWAEAILSVYNWDSAKREEFVRTAHSRARQAFSWDRVARETHAIYLKVQKR